MTAMAHVRAVCNANAPVNRLPTEVVEEVFALCSGAMPSYDPLEPKIFNGTPYSWMRFAGVCRIWRNVVHSSSPRWANIAISDAISLDSRVELVKTCLQRSAERPLNVRISSFDNMRWVSKAVFSCSSRFKSLDLESFDDRFMKLLEHADPAYNLQALRIECRDRSGFTPHLPLIFCGIIPQLRYLDLKCIMPWPAAHITSLTHLTLRASDMEYLSTEFYEFLRHNPYLQQLILDSYFPAHVPSGELGTKVAMPALASIILAHCPLGTALQLMDQLQCTSENFTLAVDASPRIGDTTEFLEVPTQAYSADQFHGIKVLVLHSGRTKTYMQYCRVTGYGASSSFDVHSGFFASR